jgi:hypothetical protein
LFAYTPDKICNKMPREHLYYREEPRGVRQNEKIIDLTRGWSGVRGCKNRSSVTFEWFD